MTPEDEKRLAEIRDWSGQTTSRSGLRSGLWRELVAWLLAKLDEEKRACTAAQSVANDALARLGEVDVALAESERARTEAEAKANVNGLLLNAATDEFHFERERADRAGAALVEAEARASAWAWAETALAGEREAHRCSIADNNRLIAELLEERANRAHVQQSGIDAEAGRVAAISRAETAEAALAKAVALLSNARAGTPLTEKQLRGYASDIYPTKPRHVEKLVDEIRRLTVALAEERTENARLRALVHDWIAAATKHDEFGVTGDCRPARLQLRIEQSLDTQRECTRLLGELAEERAKQEAAEAAHAGCGTRWGEDIIRMAQERNVWAERAETAEARVAELEAIYLRPVR